MADEQRRRAYDEAIVRDVKGISDDVILHIPAKKPLREAADFLAEHKIGLTLVISSEGALDGVISERDIIRALYEHGNDALNLPVEMFMARDVLTCSDKDLVIDVAKLMSEKHIRHLPIVEDGYLSGMISATDIVRHFASRA